MPKVNSAGVGHARSLINAGKVDKTSPWSFSTDDGNKILGENPGVEDWKRYASFHLYKTDGEPESKDGWSFPFGKDGKVFRSALVAIRQRANQADPPKTDLFDAAGTLLDMIDKETQTAEGKKITEAETMSIDKVRDKLSVVVENRFGCHSWIMDVITEDNKVNKGHVIIRVGSSSHSLNSETSLKVAYEIDKDGNASLAADTEKVEKKFIPITESITVGQFLYEAKDKSEGREGSVWRVVLIKAGTSLNGNHYPKNVLMESAGLFENVNAFARSDEEHVADQAKSVKNIVGFFREVKYEEGKITADFHILKAAEWLRENVLDAWQQGKKDLIGFSIVAEGTGRIQNRQGKTIRMVESITKVSSVDVVVDPAAGGKFLKLVASGAEQTIEEERETMDKLLKLLESIAPDIYKTINPANVTEEKVIQLITEAKKTIVDPNDELKEKLVEAEKALEDNKKEKEDAEALKLAEAKKESEKKQTDKEKTELEKLREAQQKDRDEFKLLTEGLKKDRCGNLLTESLNKSNLPIPAQDVIRKKYEGKIFEAEDLKGEIDSQREVFAKLTESGKVTGIDFVRTEIGSGEADKMRKAFDGFFDNEDIDDVPRFRSFREAYVRITGDVGLTGMERDAVNLHKFTEALTTASWPQVLGDSITRKMLKEYRDRKYDEWKLIVSDITSIKDFRTNRRMRIGGYGELPAVAQAGSYDPLTSPTDEEATYAISKRGGTETITMEMIADDDVGAIRRIPVKLARTAKITLYRFVFDFIVDNNVTTYDSVALFHATHGNLSTTALSAAALLAAKIAMSNQAGYNEDRNILGLTPKYLLIPSELQDTAFRLTSSGIVIGATNNSATEPNIHATYGLKPIEIPYWTDGTDWAMIADPKDVPTFEIGFFQGREEPELFVADNPTVGSMFTNDQIVYKIRHIYGGAVLDHRGMSKGVVAGT